MAFKLFEHVIYENTIHANPSHGMSGHAGAKTSMYIQSRAVGALHGSDKGA